jgi:hypothetical protein
MTTKAIETLVRIVGGLGSRGHRWGSLRRAGKPRDPAADGGKSEKGRAVPPGPG